MSTFNMTADSNPGGGRLFNTRNAFLALLAVAALMAITTTAVYAGAGGSEFDDVWMTLRDWSQGTLGRIIAGGFIIVGLVGGIVRQSLMSLAVGIGGGLGVYNMPEIIESLVSATLAHAPAISHAAALSNGLL